MDAELQRRAAIAEIHFRQISKNEIPVDYDMVCLTEEDKEFKVAAKVLVVFYASDDFEGMADMVVIPGGGIDENGLKTELGVIEQLTLSPIAKAAKPEREYLSLKHVLGAESVAGYEVKRRLKEVNLPLFLLMLGRRVADSGQVVVMWQLPMLESSSLLEEAKRRLRPYAC